jgi:integrase/recombinase XerC
MTTTETALTVGDFPKMTTEMTADDKLRRLYDDFFAGLKPNTLRTYQQALADFATFVGAADDRQAAAMLLSRGHGEANHLALAYRANLIERELAAATINNRIAALRSLVKLARTLGLVGWAIDVRSVRSKPYRDTTGCGAYSYRRLMSHLDAREDPKAIRDRALIRLLFELALRRGEAASLDVEHLDLDGGKISVKGKGSTERESLTLPEPTRRALADWMAIRGSAPGPLFTNLDRARKGDGRLTENGIYAIVTALGAAIGMTVRPHGLRHSAITAGLDATGGDVRAVRKFSRHAKLDTLLVYDDNRRDLAGDVSRLIAVQRVPPPLAPEIAKLSDDDLRNLLQSVGANLKGIADREQLEALAVKIGLGRR